MSVSNSDINAHDTVRVELDSRSYDIHIGHGLLHEVGPKVLEFAPGGRAIIVTDDHVNTAHGDRLRVVLEANGVSHETVCVTPGEPSKGWPVFHDVVEAILASHAERGDLVIAFGGGVIGDLAGFAASVVRRGMGFIQVPTSLLAQVDSSVGGKTGINSPHGKNLIGAFHQPTHVTIDLDVLKTLPPREFRAGYAEMVKYGLIDDEGFFAWLEANHGEVFSHGNALGRAVANSCRSKARVVAADERESGARALLNLGHTFGHALEGSVAYDGERLVHGEGVAIGMALAHRFSNRLNRCSADDCKRVEHHLQAVGLPTRIQDIPGEHPSVPALMEFIQQDKKVKRGSLTFILTRGIGSAYIQNDVSPWEVATFLETELSS